MLKPYTVLLRLLLLVFLFAGYSTSSFSKEWAVQYVVTVTAHGSGGYVLCNGQQITNASVNVMVDDGASLSVTGYPSDGYRVGRIEKQQEGFMFTNTDYTNRTSISRTTRLSYIKQNASVDVYFEEIPNPAPTYSVKVTSYGEHGYIDYNGIKIRNGSKFFTVQEGGSLSVTGYPDKGYRVSRIRTQKDVLASFSSDYTNRSSISRSAEVADLKRDASIEFYYEQLEPADPVTITASDKTVTYDGNVHSISCSVPSNVPASDVVTTVYKQVGTDLVKISPSQVKDAGSYTFVFSIDTDLYIGEKKAILTINKAIQSISWSQSFADLKVYDKVKLTATSTSGLYVSYVSENTDIAEVVIMNGEPYLQCKSSGVVRVQANQTGNTNYSAALVIGKEVAIKNADFVLISQLPDWKSSNKEHSTSSSRQYTFYASEGNVLLFDWFTSSEAEYDKLSISLNGHNILTESGEDRAGNTSCNITANALSTMDVAYVKDASYSAGYDEVSISNVYLMREAPGDYLEYANVDDGYTSFEVKRNIAVDNLLVSRTFNNTKWQALYLPFSMNYAEWKDVFDVARVKQARQYDDDEDGTVDRNVISIVKVESGDLEPNTPYFIKAKETGAKSFTLQSRTLCKTEERSSEVICGETKFTFRGTYHAIPGSEMQANGYYAMGGGALVQAASESSNLGAFRWYVEITDLEGNRQDWNDVKLLVFDDEWVAEDEEQTTTISQPSNTDSQSTPLYDLSGRRVSTPQRGIYVKDGRKVFVR